MKCVFDRNVWVDESKDDVNISIPRMTDKILALKVWSGLKAKHF